MARIKTFINTAYNNQNVYLIINDDNQAIMLDASNATLNALNYMEEKTLL